MVEDRLVESRKKEGKDTGVKNVSKRKDETVAISSGFALRGLSFIPLVAVNQLVFCLPTHPAWIPPGTRASTKIQACGGE